MKVAIFFWNSSDWILVICDTTAWILFTYCNFKFSVSSNFIVISACSSLCTSLRKSMSGSRTDDRCDALFFIANYLKCCVELIIKNSVIFVFL